MLSFISTVSVGTLCYAVGRLHGHKIEDIVDWLSDNIFESSYKRLIRSEHINSLNDTKSSMKHEVNDSKLSNEKFIIEKY